MPLTHFSVPSEDRYFEDYAPGAVYEFAETASLSEAGIIAFANAFDPQPFHIDPVKARSSIYKGLIASGAHTIGVTFAILVKCFISERANSGSPGMDEVRWLKPVRPGDTLRVRATITETKPSRSKKDRGAVSVFVETFNQRDEIVLSFKVTYICLKRNQG
ncbi:hypothetical protein FACS1894205_0660 [Alphaproteobacteria bacterium]|nr:hypothetical protein FACS1894205_0660 [Alphaproteobacteria bacterium]